MTSTTILQQRDTATAVRIDTRLTEADLDARERERLPLPAPAASACSEFLGDDDEAELYARGQADALERCITRLILCSTAAGLALILAGALWPELAAPALRLLHWLLP